MIAFFPVGHDQQTNRSIPFATIGLILVCAVAFAVTQRAIEREEKQAADLESQMAALKVQAYLEAQREKSRDLIPALIDPSARNYYELYKKLGEHVEENWKAFVSGRALDADHPLWLAYQEAAAQEQALKATSVIQRWGFTPARASWGTALTALFLHASLGHLLANMIFLYLAGFALENVWGRLGYVAFYLLAGLAADGAHWAMNLGADVPAVGASGAIAGLMGAFLLRFYKAKIKFAYYYVLVRLRFGHFWVPAYVVLPLWLAQQLLYASLTRGEAPVAYWAHIGGFGFGVLGAFLVGLAARPRPIAEPVEKAPVASPAPAFNVPERRERLAALLAAGDGRAADEARELIERLLKADNPILADQVYGETLGAMPAFAPPAAALLRLAAYHEKNWHGPQAAACYERVAATGGATGAKALLALARLQAGQLQDKAAAADAYRRLLAAAGPDDPVTDVARRELKDLGPNV